MTDTRKYIEEQFDQFFEFDTDDRSTVTSASCRFFAEHCIEQLLAVIAKKDEALVELINNAKLNRWESEDAAEALAMQPADVELVEVGVVDWDYDQGGMATCQYANITQSFKIKPATKLYTIKTKAITK